MFAGAFVDTHSKKKMKENRPMKSREYREDLCMESNNKTVELSLIVPCFEEEDVIPLFYEETTQVLKTMSCEYEILFIDDGSKDKTLEKIEQFVSQDSRVRYISFSKNFGKEVAIYAGFSNIRGEYVAVMDVDLLDPPSLLPETVRIL